MIETLQTLQDVTATLPDITATVTTTISTITATISDVNTRTLHLGLPTTVGEFLENIFNVITGIWIFGN